MKYRAGKSRKRKKWLTNSMVAAVVGCGESTVSMVKSNKRSGDSKVGQQIEVAELLLDEGLNKLLDEVKRIIQI